jgi:hypothetical protein
MKNNYNKKHLSKIIKKFAIIFFIFIFLTQLQSYSNDEIFDDYIKVPKSVVNYAKRHNLQLETDKYEIEKTDIPNGDKYKYIYPCSNKDGKIYAILYKNKFCIEITEPKVLNILYIGTR